MARYHLRFFFDWHCTMFWSANDTARERFDYPVAPEMLPIAPQTAQRAYELLAWHDTGHRLE